MMETTVHSPAGLYPELLGDSWWGLDEVVRRLHGCGAPVRASGVFQVRQGSNWLARRLARMAQLPAPGESLIVHLHVAESGNGEEWRRIFAGQPLVSWQTRRTDGLLSERMGRVELRLRLNVGCGALNYQTMGAALCLGAWRVPLPRWLRPRVTACERSAGEADQIDVSVEVDLPWLGCLIAYNGRLNHVETHAC